MLIYRHCNIDTIMKGKLCSGSIEPLVKNNLESDPRWLTLICGDHVNSACISKMLEISIYFLQPVWIGGQGMGFKTFSEGSVLKEDNKYNHLRVRVAWDHKISHRIKAVPKPGNETKNTWWPVWTKYHISYVANKMWNGGISTNYGITHHFHYFHHIC